MKILLATISILIIFLMIHIANGIQPVERQSPSIDLPIIESPEVCEDVPLRNPGGLSWRIAQVCAGEYGLYISSEANSLLPNQRERQIYTVADSLILIATEKGFLTVDIQIRDRYQGRE